jgi:hypothetical protein
MARFAEIVIVRALSGGGPYETGDVLSVAFTTPDVGRLRAHEASAWMDDAGASDATAGDKEAPRVPDVISALVLSPAGPYRRDEVIDLAFVDPSLARIHRPRTGEPQPARTNDADPVVGGGTGRAPVFDRMPTAESAPARPTEPRPVAPRGDAGLLTSLGLQPGASAVQDLELEPSDTQGEEKSKHDPSLRAPEAQAEADEGRTSRERASRDSQPSVEAAGVSVHLRWSPDRVRRFVQVCDKLFTVERLGWYRHALVLRLLVPDAVRCDDEAAAREASQHLAALREAVAESLGNPLLAAFMPNFTVTAEWLESIESAEIARALAAFRGAIAPHLTAVAPHANEIAPRAGAVAPRSTAELILPAAGPRNGEETIAYLRRDELLATPFSSIEAGLALIVPHVAADASLGEPLGAYRAKVAELFAQMADTPEKARLRTMTQSNHALDDLLWQLVSGVQQTFEPAPAA